MRRGGNPRRVQAWRCDEAQGFGIGKHVLETPAGDAGLTCLPPARVHQVGMQGEEGFPQADLSQDKTAVAG